MDQTENMEQTAEISRPAEEQEQPVAEQKCPACGAPLRFDAAAGLLVCDYCGTKVELNGKEDGGAENSGAKTGEKAASGDSVQEQISRLQRDKVLETMEPLPVYNCASCGAEVIASPEAGALTCPYCRNNIVLTQQFSGTVKPDGLIPFKVSPDKLPGAIRSFYKDKPLLTAEFFTKNRIGKVTGIYVPFWLFDCSTSGEINYQGEKRGESRESGDYRITTIRQYRLERDVRAEFRNLAVDASEKMDDALMDSVGPFRYEELVPFDPRYLAGYVADRFDKTSESVRKRSDVRVTNTVSELSRGACTSGFSGVSLLNNRQKIRVQRARYVLLPIYLVNIEYDGRTYPFAVNGQTGRVVGELPTSVHSNLLYRLKFFAVGFAAAALAIIALFVR